MPSTRGLRGQAGALRATASDLWRRADYLRDMQSHPRRSDSLSHFLFVAFAIGGVAISSGCQSMSLGANAADAFDAATEDPVIFDHEAPPIIFDGFFMNEGSKLNTIIYEAQGAGPHPTVVLLHGFPGFEKNLDLAQSIRRAGWNVVFFHYRGSWGSGGDFSFAHVIEDVGVVVEAIVEPSYAAAHRIDPERIALVGHSMGGFAALISGAELGQIYCVASLAGANMGGLVKAAAQAGGGAEQMAASLDSWSGPIVGPGGAALVAEAMDGADRFDTLRGVPQLAGKSMLLVAGRLDDVTPIRFHHDPLVEALEAEGAARLRTKIFENGDHSFSGQRIALSRTVIDWLEGDCTQAP